MRGKVLVRGFGGGFDPGQARWWRGAREALGVKPGDKLLIVVRGDTVVILLRPRSFAKAIRGLAKQPYPDNHLEKERADWD